MSMVSGDPKNQTSSTTISEVRSQLEGSKPQTAQTVTKTKETTLLPNSGLQVPQSKSPKKSEVPAQQQTSNTKDQQPAAKKEPTKSQAPPPADGKAAPKAKLPEEEAFEVLLDKTIEEIWKSHDKDGSGSLNRNESRKLIKRVLQDM